MEKSRLLCSSLLVVALTLSGCMSNSNTTSISEDTSFNNSEKEDALSIDEVVEETSKSETGLTVINLKEMVEKATEPERFYHPEETIPDQIILAGIPSPEDSVLPNVLITLEDMTISKYEYSDAIVEADGVLDENAKIKLRGNSTAINPKKPVKIKFNEKQSLFGGANAKSWTLLANYFDPTGIHNYVSYRLFDELSDEWVSSTTFVNLYVNDTYQGVYLLCDQVEAASDRIDVSKKADGIVPSECDYLVEQDMRCSYINSGKTEGSDWFWMKRDNISFELLNIEDAENRAEYIDYIKEYIDEAYEACLTGDYGLVTEYIDVDSFIDGFLIEQVIKNQDCNKSSLYYYKKADGKLTFATFWDADLSFGSGEIGIADKEEEGIATNIFMEALLNIPEFKEGYINRFNELSPFIKQFVNETIDYCYANYGHDLSNDYDYWASFSTYCNEDMQGLTYEEQISYMKNWFNKRMEFLANYWNN